MMAEIVNLRLARKARKRAERQSEASANRAKFGQSKEEKKAARLNAERAARTLDGAKREGN